MSVERAGEYPIRTALSGPAAGVVGAVHIAQLAGYDDVITLDMGGTSADVALIRGGKAGISFDQRVADYPVRLPMVDVNTIGAGGGSIAWFDRDGLLKVGPASAGAEPDLLAMDLAAPSQPSPMRTSFLVVFRHGAFWTVKWRSTRRYPRTRFPDSEKLGFSVERTAHGVIGIVVANMVRAIRAISVERGHDPRAFANGTWRRGSVTCGRCRPDFGYFCRDNPASPWHPVRTRFSRFGLKRGFRCKR